MNYKMYNSVSVQMCERRALRYKDIQNHVGACKMLIMMSTTSLFPPWVSASLKVPLSRSRGEFGAER